MQVARRTFLKGAAAGIGAAALTPRLGFAANTLSIGGMEVTTVSDGFLTQPADFMFAPMPQEELAAFLETRGMGRDANLTPPCNVTLIRHDDRLILIDAGSGTGWLDTVGDLPDALDAMGVDPGDVTHVVFTHAHPDHLWGVLDDFDETFFFNAQHMMGRVEFDYWTDPATIDTVTEARVPMAAGAKRRLDMVGEQFSFFEHGAEILPGLTARATFGHSPGHMGFALADGGAAALVVGDALLNDHTAFAHPDWPIGADMDRETGAATRMGLLDQLATDDMALIGFHLPGSGIGHVERHDGAYRFTPT